MTQAAAAHVRSPLPGYPRFRGVVLTRGHSAVNVARQRAIRSALQSASSSTSPECADPTAVVGANLCYQGGPVVGANTVHVIFWKGPVSPPSGVTPFPADYLPTLKTYFTDVAHDSGQASNVYSVSTQYGDRSGSGAYQVSFNPVIDVDEDTNPFPTGECTDAATDPGPCVTDKQLREEIASRIASNGKGWTSSLHDLFFIFTPKGVGSCFSSGSSAEVSNLCALAENGFCGYHGSFGPAGSPTLYANIPDNAEIGGCDSSEYPAGAVGSHDVDGTLDTLSHEHNEMVTDPLEKEPAWTDVIGQEEADKCLAPETFSTYGGALGGTPAESFESAPGVFTVTPGTLFNQLINGHRYWLQTEWSNTAGEVQGGCVQRMLNAAFIPPASAAASVPASFDGSASGSAGDPAEYWVWDFGDGMQSGTPAATVAHTYALAGAYEVTLTAVDAAGNSNTVTHTVTVGEAPPPPPPLSSPPVATSTTTNATAISPIHLTVSELAAKLGLPNAGAGLSGLGTIALGRAECPPACGIALSLYTSVRVKRHRHRLTRRVLIGSLHTTVAAGGTGALALVLNPTGRALLIRAHRLRIVLKASVEDQQGAVWQLSRSLTLTSAGHAAGRAGHAAERARG
jgi:hypothetical protein